MRETKRHKAHEGSGHGYSHGSHSGGPKSKHHDGVKSSHGGRKPKKRSAKEQASIMKRLEGKPM